MSPLVREAAVDLIAIAPARRPWRRALAWTAAIALACIWIERGTLWSTPVVRNDQHALTSIAVAFNEARCGGKWKYSVFDLLGGIDTRPESWSVPMSTLAGRAAGSLRAYCDSLTSRYVINEPSLKWVAHFIFVAAPNASLRTLGLTLRWLRVVLLLVAVLLLLRTGVSVLATFAIAASGFAMLDALQGFVYSVYPFLFIVPLLVVCGYAAVSPLSTSSMPARSLAAVAFAGGIVSGIGYNFRTSHLAVFVALSLTAAWIFTAEHAGRARWPRAALFVLAAIAGQAAFQLLIARGIPADNRQYAYHVVWHPVVLSLAIPENPLSRREGITWNDGAGFMLARRINPNVESMMAGYDDALRKYYFALWRESPRDMAAVYLRKARISGVDILQNANDIGRPVSSIPTAASILPNGFALLWATALALLASLAWFGCARKPIAALSALTLVVLLLTHAEAALVMPKYVVSYHNVFVFFSAMSIILLLQILVDAAVRWIETLTALTNRHAQQI